MKRHSAEWAVWVIAGVLLVAVIVTVAVKTVMAADISVKATEAKPLINVDFYTEDGLIDINTAPAELLSAVDGIGDIMANRIVAFREENGPYHSLNDLYKVKGFTEKMLKKAKPYIGLVDLS